MMPRRTQQVRPRDDPADERTGELFSYVDLEKRVRTESSRGHRGA